MEGDRDAAACASGGATPEMSFKSIDIDIPKDFDSFFRLEVTKDHQLVDGKIIAIKKSSFACLCCEAIVPGPLNPELLVAHLQSCATFVAGQLSELGQKQRKVYLEEDEAEATAGNTVTRRWRKWQQQEEQLEPEVVWTAEKAKTNLEKAEETMNNVTVGLAALEMKTKLMGSFLTSITKTLSIPPEMKHVKKAVDAFHKKYPEEYMQTLKKSLAKKDNTSEDVSSTENQ